MCDEGRRIVGFVSQRKDSRNDTQLDFLNCDREMI